MRLSLTTAFLLFLSLVSALTVPRVPRGWRVRFYKDTNYVNQVIDKTGQASSGCIVLPKPLNNVVSSMKAELLTDNWGYCWIRLYSDAACGKDMFGFAQQDWFVKDFRYINGPKSPSENDKLSSYEVDCLGALGKA